MPRTVQLNIENGDILSFRADVVALKFAQKFLGADKAVAMAIRKQDDQSDLEPPVGSYRLIVSQGAVAAPYALLVGVVNMREFRYEQIREFAIRALVALSVEMPDVRHVAMTVHGPTYGLDESESVLAQLAGCIQALQEGAVPSSLERITFVEINGERAERFRKAMNEYLLALPGIYRDGDQWAYPVKGDTTNVVPGRKRETVPAASDGATQPGASSENKPHAFIAMPFKKDMEDIFYYGIQQPVHNAGLLCERVDKTEFTGGIMEYVRERIETSSVVIAELSGANPNVYLEVGYAWGKKRPVILLVNDEKHLQFDVQGQRCLTYSSIKELESMLGKEIKGMIAKGIVKA